MPMALAADRIEFLNVPPSCEAAGQDLLPGLRAWFAASHGEPTLAQRYAWPTIQRNQHLLLCSPTGSGKTLAAFVPILSRILAAPAAGLQCLYVAPLKALGRDVRCNLKRACQEIQNEEESRKEVIPF
jgi:Lhr-like helicase